MRLTSQFSVPLPQAEAWRLLLDIERVARWFPGARLDTSDGDTHRGTVRVKLGPMLVDYRGTATFVERDEGAGRVVIEASGREQRGAGTATARAVTSLAPAGASTEVSVSVDLDITGRPAQLGQGLMQDVAGRLVAEFASRMAAELSAAGAPAPAAEPGAEPGTSEPGTSEPGTSPEPGTSSAGGDVGRAQPPTADPTSSSGDDVLDLGRVAGAAVLRRARPALAAGALLGLAAAWLAARRARRRRVERRFDRRVDRRGRSGRSRS